MRIASTILGAAAVAASLLGTAPAAIAAGPSVAIPSQDWSFSGVFGTFDRASAQRGFQVYKEICSGCHGLDYIHFRNLEGIGFNEAEIKAIAAEYEVPADPNEEGEIEDRPARPSDRWPNPFPNANAARAANGGALPPDLSLIVEARAGGADYLYAVLTGYDEAPDDAEVGEGMSYNTYYPGHQIAMAQPLYGDDVEYSDGTEATLEQHARDVTTFLTWAAEPNLEERRQMGVTVILFLLVLTGLLYASKRKIWSDLH